MPRGVRVTALCIALALASMRSTAQSPLRGQPITLTAPVNDFTTFNVVSRLLAEANVPYGLEGPSTEAARPAIDFAQGPSQPVTIQAQSIDDALKQIAAVHPRMRWSRAGGLIVVRFGPDGDGFLDQRLEQFTVNGASPRGALEALLAVVDPDRAAGLGVQGAGRPPAGREGEGSTRAGAPITLSLTDVRVVDVLNAIATANGAMSWIVSYDPGRARYETASIQFIEGGYRVTALSKLSLAPPVPVTSDARGAVSVPITGDLRSMLMAYSQQTGMRFGMEQVPGQPEAPRSSMAGIPPITLPSVPTDDVVAKIVAFDSRYEWSQRDGFYRIRPRAGTAGRLDILDTARGEFVAAGDSLDYVLDRIASLLSGQPAGPSGLSLSFSNAPGGSRMALARVTPVTFTVPAGGTIADLIDALCRAEGTLSWHISLGSPGQPMAPSSQMQLTLSSSLGWSYGRGIRAPEVTTARPVAARPPLPSTLERSIGRLPLSFGPASGTAFVALGAFAKAPIGVEIYPALTIDDDPRAVRRPPASVVLGPGRLSEAVHTLLERMPEYSMTVADATMSIAPQKLLESRTHFMNVPIDRFEVRDVSIYRAVTMLRQRLNRSYVVGEWMEPNLGPPGVAMQSAMARSKMLYEKRVTLSVTNATPREILNRLVAAHGELGWAVSYELRTPSPLVPVRIDETTCVIRLIPFAGTAFMADLPPAMPATAPSVPVPPPPPPGGRILAELPMDVARMSAVVNRLSVVLSTPVGVEIVMSSAIPAGAGTRPGAGSQAYDLTGLAMGDALGKVTDWMPEYAWSLDDGVYHLRPRAANPVSHALDIRVDRFAGRFDDVRMAATAIRDLIDRSLPTRSPVTGTGSPVLSANPGPDMQKAVAFDATNVSLRQLLDTFATQHGRLSWMMEARRQTNGLNALLLRIQTFDGVTLNLSPIVR